MNKATLKQLPSFATDEEAEEFVDTADLSEYDLSGFVPLDVFLSQPDGETYVLVPKELAEAVRAKAAELGIPFSRLVREALEQSLAK